MGTFPSGVLQAEQKISKKLTDAIRHRDFKTFFELFLNKNDGISTNECIFLGLDIFNGSGF